MDAPSHEYWLIGLRLHNNPARIRPEYSNLGIVVHHEGRSLALMETLRMAYGEVHQRKHTAARRVAIIEEEGWRGGAMSRSMQANAKPLPAWHLMVQRDYRKINIHRPGTDVY